ncbi:MAG: hypothetical protein A3J97_13350 [Spirochaetes bacterium RIFOXYC1_FULL_54_7]|nr:MAG: hypothetical protein A3J97_13350 [Spirochaetes bacterium RIFOXYC1_FULL_54_7]
MGNLLAKIVGMSLQGASTGPALILIPRLLAGALVAGVLSLRNYREEWPGISALEVSTSARGTGSVASRFDYGRQLEEPSWS